MCVPEKVFAGPHEFPCPVAEARVRPSGGVVALHEFVAIEERKRALVRTRMAMPYQLQKCATWRHFQRFLRRVPGQTTGMSCTPDHVISYLIRLTPTGEL